MGEKTKYYAHAMTTDPDTGKPMPKVFNVNGGSGGNSRRQTIQTHNAISLNAGATSNGQWINCEDFDVIAITRIGAGVAVAVQWSNDGSNIHAGEGIGTAALGSMATEASVKAKWCRVVLNNTSGATMTTSAWAYLKA